MSTLRIITRISSRYFEDPLKTICRSEDDLGAALCDHPHRDCADCELSGRCSYLCSILQPRTFQCRYDGECGGCPDFYECPIIFGGDIW